MRGNRGRELDGGPGEGIFTLKNKNITKIGFQS